MITDWLKHLTTRDAIWRPWAFDRVTICDRTGQPIVSLLGICYSEYKGGPNLLMLADIAGVFFGPGLYGLASCRALGFRPVSEAEEALL